MVATERLYYNDSHLTEFDARVVAAASPFGDDRVALVLDRTAFYPTGGGQPCDTGTIAGMRVVECVEGSEGAVLHFIEDEAPSAGEHVSGRVDWPRRRDHIQQHTGQHILSQTFVELFGAQTRGFRMLDAVSEIDVELEGTADERVEQAVERANEIIWENRAVRIHHVTADVAAAMPLRKDSAREGELRVIEIEGFDMSPCGGTHALRTGEVGVIAARSWERAKGMTRIEFVAGGRALADYRRANETARGVAALFSAGRDEATAAVARLLEEHRQTLRRVRALEEVAAVVEAKELIDAAHARTCEGTLVVACTLEARDAESLKRVATAVVSRIPSIVLLGTRDGENARLVFARSIDSTLDMNALMREACALIDGRGGGRPELAQGGGRDVAKLVETIEVPARKISA